ncbi:two-component system response regulator NreC [Rhodococcus sp. 27YEA15]|uniref:response regulator n=1 Tax=Rhodococcus sp. 27YEA15 TaxID=3156259 RepID=UPI003C7A93E8
MKTNADPQIIRIFSIDDHEVIHAGLARMAERESDLIFLGAAKDVVVARRESLLLSPDIIMLDLFLREEQSWSLCLYLLTVSPKTKVVFYTGYGNAQLVDRALHMGASGFILKAASMSALPDMIRTVARSGQYIDPELLKEWVDSRRVPAGVSFNDQELLIVSMISDGMDNYAIAERMNLSFHTVKFHIGKLLKRTGENNRAGLVRFAKDRFLIE